MTKIRSLIVRHLHALRSAIAHGPLETSLGVFLALAFSVAVVVDTSQVWRYWGRMLASALMLLPTLLSLSTSAHTGRLTPRRRWAFSGALVVAAALYAAFGVDPDKAGDLWRTGFAVVALWSALVLAPLASRRPSDAADAWFWTANHRLVARFTTVSLFAFTLFVGLALALTAVDTLFSLHLHEDPYLHLFGVTFFALVPALVVGSLPEMTLPVGNEPPTAPRMIRWVGGYLVSPLLVVYVAILYAYNVKSLFSAELPQNALSPLALGAAAVAWVGILLTDPLKLDDDVPVTVPLLRLFPAYFLPLTALPIWAVWLRVSEYGWTEFRVVRLALLLGVLVYCVVGVVRLVQRRKFSIRVIPIILVTVFGLCAVGPWSATAISKRSQLSELRSALADLNRLTPDGTLDRTPLPDTSEDPEREQLEHRAQVRAGELTRYLARHFGDAYLLNALGVEDAASTQEVFVAMGIHSYGRWDDANEEFTWYLNGSQGAGVWLKNVPAGDHMELSWWRDFSSPGTQTWIGGYDVATTMGPLTVVVNERGAEDTCTFDLAAFEQTAVTERIAAGIDGGPSGVPPVDLSGARGDGVAPDGTSCGVLILFNLRGTVENAEEAPRLKLSEWSGRWIR